MVALEQDHSPVRLEVEEQQQLELQQEVERLRSAQVQTERTLEARERAHRQRVRGLEEQVLRSDWAPALLGLQNQQDSPRPSLGSLGQDGSVNLEEEGEGEGEKGKRAERDLLGIKSMAPITGPVWWIYAGVSHGGHGFKWSLELSSFAMALLASGPCPGRPSPWVAQVASVAPELRVSQQPLIPEERGGLSLRATAKVVEMPLPDRP